MTLKFPKIFEEVPTNSLKESEFRRAVLSNQGDTGGRPHWGSSRSSLKPTQLVDCQFFADTIITIIIIFAVSFQNCFWSCIYFSCIVGKKILTFSIYYLLLFRGWCLVWLLWSGQFRGILFHTKRRGNIAGDFVGTLSTSFCLFNFRNKFSWNILRMLIRRVIAANVSSIVISGGGTAVRTWALHMLSGCKYLSYCNPELQKSTHRVVWIDCPAKY